jgi:pyruvate dehydrogenase E1 component alpha subunit
MKGKTLPDREKEDSFQRFFPHQHDKLIKEIDQKELIHALRQMLLIRNFEFRAESAYLQGKIGGFFHSYIGQEAIQIAAVQVLGPNNWYITSYRCHALALLLGATPNELMAELFGRTNGNARGRGGSMHFYTDRMLGGFGIVTGQLPIAVGAAFSLKYKKIKDQAVICFLGDGAVAQGAFHESLNLASLWDLPCIFVIENNHWGMGTPIEKAVCVKRLAEDLAPGYNVNGYTFDGMDYFNCYNGFKHIYSEVLKTSRPVLVEVVTDRFKGHSISDPGLYRTKESLKSSMMRDPLILLKQSLIKADIITLHVYKELENEAKEIIVAAMKYAEESPWPNPITLGEDIFAPETEPEIGV